MAELKMKVTINGLNLAIKAIQNVLDTCEFSSDASDDFKDGFLFFGNSAVQALKEVWKEGVEDGRTSDVFETNH